MQENLNMADRKTDQQSKDGVSVIICCYNSATRLPTTLSHLQQQVVPHYFFWEIIVVNNASKDQTEEIVKSIWQHSQPFNATCRIIREQRPGQMFARDAGVAAAKYDCIIFCDDDNWLGNNYVYTAWRLLNQDGNIGAAGGKNIPVSDTAYPDWFDEYKDKYATGIPAERSGDISARGFVLGAGLITRRSLFETMFTPDYPSLLKGRNGEKLSTGDDFEYCKRLLLRGYSLYYDDTLSLWHFIPSDRLTIQYRERLMEGIDEAGKVLEKYDEAILIQKRIKGKNKNRLRILIPFRILLTTLGLSKRNIEEERLTQFYISRGKDLKDTARTAIKNFIHQHQ